MKDGILKKELMDQITDQLQSINTLEYGSEKQAQVVDNVTKLYKLALEEERLDNDYEENMDKAYAESEHKKVEFEEQKKERKLKLVLGVLGPCVSIGTLIFDAVWMKRGFKFEESGIYTSDTFKRFNRFKHR